jgi:hypothetical protein
MQEITSKDLEPTKAYVVGKMDKEANTFTYAESFATRGGALCWIQDKRLFDHEIMTKRKFELLTCQIRNY